MPLTCPSIVRSRANSEAFVWKVMGTTFFFCGIGQLLQPPPPGEGVILHGKESIGRAKDRRKSREKGDLGNSLCFLRMCLGDVPGGEPHRRHEGATRDEMAKRRRPGLDSVAIRSNGRRVRSRARPATHWAHGEPVLRKAN